MTELKEPQLLIDASRKVVAEFERIEYLLSRRGQSDLPPPEALLPDLYDACRELRAARQKNGIYGASGVVSELTLLIGGPYDGLRLAVPQHEDHIRLPLYHAGRYCEYCVYTPYFVQIKSGRRERIFVYNKLEHDDAFRLILDKYPPCRLPEYTTEPGGVYMKTTPEKPS